MLANIASRTAWLSLACITALAVFPSAKTAYGQDVTMDIWPGTPPGRLGVVGEEQDTSKPGERFVAGKSVIRLGDVSKPMMTIYPPDKDKNTGAAVVVFPGGGYHILAYDLEGTEVCQWLQSIGVTGVLLKYRVPKPAGDRGVPVEPMQDAQRAVSLTRQNAEAWGIDPQRIGVLGFSAGGHLAARLSTNYAKLSYEAIDATDQISSRPDFAVLIYPAYLFDRNDANSHELSASLPVDKNTPPMFMSMAFDDPVGPENILRMGLALKKVGVPAELHMYPSGGHGYGLRITKHHATTWAIRCGEWMKSTGLLDK